MQITDLDIKRITECIGVYATNIVAQGKNFVTVQTSLYNNNPTDYMHTLIRGLNSIGYHAVVQDNTQLRVNRKTPDYS
jgi:hypothetical protein